jgi:hypothetical protein
MHDSRSHDAVIRVYDEAGNVIETHCSCSVHERFELLRFFMLDRSLALR